MTYSTGNCDGDKACFCSKDVYTYIDRASFPTEGVENRLYIDDSTGAGYYWNGTAYVPMASDFTIEAYNGTSVDGTGKVVLGNDVGSTEAQLVSHREIPLNGFNIRTNGGNTNAGSTDIWLQPTILGINYTGTYTGQKNHIDYFRNGSLRWADGTRDQDNTNSYYFARYTDTGVFNGNVYEINRQTGGFFLGGNTPISTLSPTGNVPKLYVKGTNGEDTVIDSGQEDYSGLVLSQLDGNSPKQNSSNSTPLAYDNATGLVVPYDITTETFDTTRIGLPSGTILASSIPIVNGAQNIYSETLVGGVFNLGVPQAGHKWRVTARYQIGMNSPSDRGHVAEHYSYAIVPGIGTFGEDKSSIPPSIPGKSDIASTVNHSTFTYDTVSSSTQIDVYVAYHAWSDTKTQDTEYGFGYTEISAIQVRI